MRQGVKQLHLSRLNIFLVFWMVLILMSMASIKAHAEAELRATPSSTDMTSDENISVEFTVTVDESNAAIEQPTYEAPDFDEVNVVSGVTGIVSTYTNGVFSVKRTQGLTVVLHPKKEGRLTIRNIQAQVNGKVIHAPNIEIMVHPSGQSRSSGGTGYLSNQQNMMPGTGTRPVKQNSSLFFVRTEPSKLKAYKGEQIILTYALYTRAQILGIQVERYPTVPGFLKEDIDIPLLSMRLQYTPTVVNGQEYHRAVLAQYAIYPLKDGKLAVDPLTGKFSYRAQTRMGLDQDDDPFGLLNRFFNAMQTQMETKSSDRVTIDVLPLPSDGQPESFSGLVGDFDITAVVDKYTVKVGEPITVKVKIDGRGHAGSLERLNVDWPKDFELYEDKSHTNVSKTGTSERIFDFMLIPRVKGNFQIPPIEISMFDPQTRDYRIRKTEPIAIEVLEGSLGNIYVAKNKDSAAVPESQQDIRYWMTSSFSSHLPSGKVWKKVSGGVAMASMGMLILSLWSLTGSADRRFQSRKVQTKKALYEKVRALRESTATPTQILADAESCISQWLQLQYNISMGSLTRTELKEQLLACGMELELAQKFEALLEQCENLRFVPDVGNSQWQIAQQVVAELTDLVEKTNSKMA